MKKLSVEAGYIGDETVVVLTGEGGEQGFKLVFEPDVAREVGQGLMNVANEIEDYDRTTKDAVAAKLKSIVEGS